MSKKEKKGLGVMDITILAVSIIILIIGGITFGMAMIPHTASHPVSSTTTSTTTTTSSTSSTSSSSTTTSSTSTTKSSSTTEAWG